VDESKPLPHALENIPCRNWWRDMASTRGSASPPLPYPTTRGLHSSTFWLNVSTFCGIGGVEGVFRGRFREFVGHV